jgi:hypothetical protein
MTSDDQCALLRVWAHGTDIVLDTRKRPKAEFARLAKSKGWIGGDKQWKVHWEACFDEAYPYGGGGKGCIPVELLGGITNRTSLGMRTNIATNNVATTKTMTTEAAQMDLADRMRRLSVGSTESSYSLISEVSTVQSLQSLDSDGSVGGVLVSPPTIKTLETCLEALAIANRNLEVDTKDGDAIDDASSEASGTKSPRELDPSNIEAFQSSPSPYWLQFPGFEPNPTATFKKELARLAKHENWSTKTRHKEQVKALTTELAHHYGTHFNKLDQWQQLCEDVGIDVIPTSITQCRKVHDTT